MEQRQFDNIDSSPTTIPSETTLENIPTTNNIDNENENTTTNNIDNNEEQEEEEENSIIKKRKLESPICQICSQNNSKYTCPGCEIKYCSVNCYKNHIQNNLQNCNGKRDPTKFVDLTNFTTRNIKNDYNFLENLEKETNKISKNREINKIDSHPYQFHLPKSKELQIKSLQRKIRLELMSIGMKRREENTSYYNRKGDKIYWRIEFLFDQQEQLENQLNNCQHVIEKHVCEDLKVKDIITKYLDKNINGNAKTRDLLQKYAYIYEKSLNNKEEDFKFGYFLQVPNRPKNETTLYYQLNENISLKEALKDMIIIEYPTIHIVLPSHKHLYNIISKELMDSMIKEREDKIKEKKEKRQAFLDRKNKKKNYQENNHQRGSYNNNYRGRNNNYRSNNVSTASSSNESK
ncbi:hypothetical protein ABK040_005997 [Willaertia magna]